MRHAALSVGRGQPARTATRVGTAKPTIAGRGAVDLDAEIAALRTAVADDLRLPRAFDSRWDAAAVREVAAPEAAPPPVALWIRRLAWRTRRTYHALVPYASGGAIGVGAGILIFYITSG